MTANDPRALPASREDSGNAMERAAGPVVDFIETHHLLVLFLLLLTVAAAVLPASVEKPLWLDEYYSLHTAMLPSPGAIWAYQRTSPIALDPPLYHWLSHYPVRILGNTALAARLVSVLFYLLFTVCIFTLLRRVANAMTAVFAVTFALSTGLFDYAFEARPYSLLVGAGAGALLMWYWSWYGKYRLLALFGLAVCIATAMLGHYFGALIAIPIAIGELVRWWMRRRIAIGVPLALLAAGGFSAALYLPLMAPLKLYQVKYFEGVSLRLAMDTYTLLLAPGVITFAFLIVGVAVTVFFVSSLPGVDGRGIRLDAATATAFVGFALLPFFGYLLAKFMAHTFVPRFALPTGIGIVLLVALGVGRAARGRAALPAAAVLMTLIYPAMRAAPQLLHARHAAGWNPSVSALMKEPDLPIVVGRLEHAFQMSDHMRDSIRQRCVLLTSPAQADIVGDRTDILSTAGMQKLKSVRVDIQDYDTFVRSHPRFLIVGNVFGMRQWVVEKVLHDGGNLQLVGVFQFEGASGESEVFSANMAAPGTSKAE